MFPSRRLAALAERKSALQTRIALRRMECAVAGRDLARLLEDLAVRRARLRRWRFALRWAPVVLRALRLVRRAAD